MEINAHNYKDVLLQWLEGELSPREVLQAEAYILVNEAAAKEWQLLQKTKLQPSAQVFFPKKHLLMKEEEDVVVAPIAVAEIVEEETVIRSISGGFNFRKLVIPMSIAASLLLFFLFFTNRNSVQDNGNNSVAEIEKVQPKFDDQTQNTKPELASKDVEKTNNKVVIEADNHTVKNKIAVNKKPVKNKTSIKDKKQDEAFFASSTYAKNQLEERYAKQENMALVKIEPLALVTNQEIKNTTHLKKSLAKQNQEKQKWQKALEEKENALVDAQNQDVERGVLGTLIHFFTKDVQIKKRTENDVNYYAFRLETEKIKIEKTFKSTF